MICENEQKVRIKDKDGSTEVIKEKCKEIATKKRATWHFGDQSKGEPSIVDVKVNLCGTCAESWDESKREAEWEAKVS